MASLRTEITEIATGLGTLGFASVEEALSEPSPRPQLRNVDSETWARLVDAYAARRYEGEFLASFNNGRALLRAEDGLRGRLPASVEWKGAHRDPADDAVPADLRIDHVYLVSCKYMSKVLHNASPWALFDRCLAGGSAPRGGDWFEEVAPAEHQAHYQAVRRLVDGGERLPEKVGDLDSGQRRSLAAARDLSSPESSTAYAELTEAVSRRSARHWAEGLAGAREQRAMLWRLLRLSATPYFVLGTGSGETLRLRVATPWDWHQAWELRSLEVAPEPGGQPRVGWRATVRQRTREGARQRTQEGVRERTGVEGNGVDDIEVLGHVEVRWSHGRLGGSPEAKVYLDTPHRQVPGYIALR